MLADAHGSSFLETLTRVAPPARRSPVTARGLAVAALLTLGAALGCAGKPVVTAAPAAAPMSTALPASALVLATEIATLDAVLAARWQAAGVVPARLADDGEFMRRVSLDLIGRTPSLAEITAFLADRTAGKRVALVDGLLASPAFGVHWGDGFGDLLLGTQPRRRLSRSDPRAFLARAFAENRPYDQLARALLTAQGTAGVAAGDDNEEAAADDAAAFVATRLRGGGGPEAVAGAAARIFLGLQIQCAQCHDHPYDPRWKQRDFYGLAGYFARVRARRVRAPDNDAGDRAAKGMVTDAPAAMSAPPARSPRVYEVVDLPRGEAKMSAPGAQQEIVVSPRFLGRVLEERPGESRRQAVARAVVASDLFAKAFVGWAWRQLFGAAPLDPWDDLGAELEATHPVLLVTLADGFRGSGHDVKRLVRRIVLSTAYARSAAPATPGHDDGGAAVRVFARARVRPLSPEQLVESLLIATGTDPSDDKALRLAGRALRAFRFAFDDDEMAESDVDATMPQALLLLNGELVNRGVRARSGSVLADILAGTDVHARIDRMFLAAYARLPHVDERAAFLAVLPSAAVSAATPASASVSISAEQRRAYEDAYFSLLLSTEATTNH